MGEQIFGYTPPNPEAGIVGYMAAVYVVDAEGEPSLRLSVRSHGETDPALASLELPLAEGVKLAMAIIGKALIASGGSDPLLQFFQYVHLPPHLQQVSAPFGIMAAHIVSTLPRNPERTVALRKLLEAKDCAVRALIWKDAS